MIAADSAEPSGQEGSAGFFFRIHDQLRVDTVATIPEAISNHNQPHPFIMSVIANIRYLHEMRGTRRVLLKYRVSLG